MLTRLSISNLAIIQALALDIGGGFTVLTGETGAGKSILIEALRFVLGEKAVVDQVRSGAGHTRVEAVFDISALPEVRRRLGELDIPEDGELTLRRMMQNNGRSRALANDCVITQTRLEALGDYLVNIHGQHDNQLLLQPAHHIDFLDAFGNLMDLRGRVEAVYGEYTALIKNRKALREEAERRGRRREELTAVLEELKGAGLMAGEEEALRAEHALLSHAERLIHLLGAACEALHDGEETILERLGEVAGQVAEAASVDTALAPQKEALTALRAQVEDLTQSLRTRAAGLESNPERLETVNARLAELEKIQRRHGEDLAAVLRTMGDAERELGALEDAEADLARMDEEVARVAAQLHAFSVELSKARKAVASRFDKAVAAQLDELGMERARFTTGLETLRTTDKGPSYSQNGMDRVEFLLSTNPGQPQRPLARVASGGELSRTMLALKSVLTEADPTKTLIFDEVDAGISGKMAEIVGRKLRRLGATHQVLCVTHLPQIAALSEAHVRVSKHAEAGETFTRAEPLDETEKVAEVARLLSGIEVTPQSLASAEELVSRGRQGGA